MRFHRTLALLFLAAVAWGEPASPRVMERYKQMLAANPVEGVALDRLWKSAMEGGGTDKLIAEYQKGGTFATEMILGHLLRRAGRDDDAAEAFGRAARLEPANALPLLALGNLAGSRAQPARAAEWLEKALALMPKDDARMAETLMQLGAAWSAAGDPAKAAEAWERTLAREPDNLELRRRLANACAENNLPEVAIRHLEFLVERSEPAGRAQALQQIAKLHSGAGRPADATKALERAVGYTAPGNWLRSELLGQIIRLAQRQDAGAELERKWRQQVEANPRDLGGYLQLVEFYERTGNIEQQRAWLGKVVGLVPKNGENEVRLARLLVQMDQLDEAAVHFDRQLAMQPRNTDLVFERARLDLRREDGATARSRITTMLAARKDDETLRGRALDFFRENLLLDLVEEHLRADALSDGEESLFALATFYFSQRRNNEAREAMARLFKPGVRASDSGARHLRAAQLLKEHGELTAAIAEVGAAIVDQPGVREPRLLLGELRAMLRQFPEARAAYEVAYLLSKSDSERLEVDGRLFESFQAVAKPSSTGGPKGASPAAVVEGYIRELMSRANEAKSVEGWLRVARWKAWNGDKASAVTFASKAAAMEPKNPAPVEFLARHSASNGDGPYALVYFRELIELNPAGRDGYLREIAQLELQRGNPGEALSVFEELARANPGNPDALADLASAQERAGKVKEAAGTWRKVLAVAPAPRKREVSASLLRVIEQLGMHDEAAGLLLRAVDETPDERERFGRFDELLLFCERHTRLGWLRSILEKRRQGRADDYFVQVALGRVLKLLGEKDAAFELFADAIHAAPNQVEALPELVREAEDLRRIEVAVRLQEQFTRVTPQERSDAFVKLAALQEKAGDLDGAERTWGQAVAKFPRDAEVLRRAADFHQQWGDRERAAMLLRKLVALDPTNFRAAADLGEIEFGAGHLPGAREAFEMVMKLTGPVTQLLFPSERGDGPWSERGAFSDFRMRRDWSGSRLFLSAAGARKGGPPARPDAEAEMRLGALRKLAEIARGTGGAALEKWISEWTGAPPEQPTEALWALYFSGAREQAVTMVEAMSRKEPAVLANRQAFIWMALESGHWVRIGEWLNDGGRTGEDMELFTLAFGEIVKARPELIGDAMMKGLFPAAVCARQWQSAIELAANRRTREAIVLGRRVFDAARSQRPAIGRELARWHLALGEVEEARGVLARACESEGESFDSAVFAAMRDLYFLLPREQRAAFVEQRFQAGEEASIHGLITRVLLHGLEGRSGKALAALDAVLVRKPLAAPAQDESNSAVRSWKFALGAGNQLMEWDLPKLALATWEKALSDEGLVALQQLQWVRQKAASIESQGEPWGERGSLRDIVARVRDQSDALRYSMGGPAERAAIVAARQRRGPDADLSRLGEALESQRATAAAAGIFRMLWEQDPQNPAALRKLLDACRAADDSATAEAVRRRCLEERINPGNDTTPREFALELADLLEQRGAVSEALNFIGRAVERDPGELRLLYRQAQLFERMAKFPDAEVAWQRLAKMEGGTAHVRGSLALLFEERGKFREASEVRLRGGASGDTQLPVLYFKDGQTEKAVAALEKLTGNGAVHAAMTLAEATALKGDGKLARSVLVTAAAKATDARGLMQVRSKLLTIPGFPPASAFVTRMQHRMREAAAQEPALSEAYYEFFDRHAARFGREKEWQEELQKAWADGNGPTAAGLVLIRRQCESGDAVAARRTCEKLLARPDATMAMIEKLGRLFEQAHRPELRLLAAEAGARQSWPDAQGTLEWVRLLDAQGAREQARTVVARHEWLAGFGGGAEALGISWLALGDASRAREFLQLALRENALVPSPGVLAAMARVHLAAKNVTAAKLLLQRAFAEPSCHEMDALLEYLDAAGGLAHWRDGIAEFRLPARAVHELKRALFSHFESNARLREALALIAEEPALIDPVGMLQVEKGRLPVDCGRVRALARRTGGFEEAAEVLERLAALNAPDAAAELASLYADWAETGGGPGAALPHIERAATLRPTTWEFARRTAESYLARHEPEKARAAIERFLWVSQAPLEREAAFDLWERANGALAGSRAGS